jgi:hypothetical protein
MQTTERWTPDHEWDAMSLRECQVEHELEALMEPRLPTPESERMTSRPHESTAPPAAKPKFQLVSLKRDRPAA